jgi:hypothetical protein
MGHEQREMLCGGCYSLKHRFKGKKLAFVPPPVHDRRLATAVDGPEDRKIKRKPVKQAPRNAASKKEAELQTAAAKNEAQKQVKSKRTLTDCGLCLDL